MTSNVFKRRDWITTALALIFAISGSVNSMAQDSIVAFGDSITAGKAPFDEKNQGGYPARMEKILRKTGLANVEVVNAGLGGETTSEGLSRINSVLAANSSADLFILMEGTNDVNLVNSGLLSIETVVSNIEGMASKVRGKGIDVIYATVIPRPPWARQDSSNFVTFELVLELRELTSKGNRPIAEPFDVFENRAQKIFSKYYFKTDPVGHPNANGFDLMAEIFADKVLDNDTLAPVVSGFSKTRSGKVLAAGDDLFSLIHESGEGISQKSTYITINGVPVDSVGEGSARRTTLTYRVQASDIECAGRVTVRTEDRADPGNVRNELVAEYDVQGATHLRGDVNGDCRVDGLDLSLLGTSFGSQADDSHYSRLADNTGDGKVDGNDLARLARNFGKSSE